MAATICSNSSFEKRNVEQQIIISLMKSTQMSQNLQLHEFIREPFVPAAKNPNYTRMHRMRVKKSAKSIYWKGLNDGEKKIAEAKKAYTVKNAGTRMTQWRWRGRLVSPPSQMQLKPNIFVEVIIYSSFFLVRTHWSPNRPATAFQCVLAGVCVPKFVHCGFMPH